MDNRKNLLTAILIAALGLAAVTALTWGNYRYALQNPGGNDFLPRWLGTRLFLLQGKSPYSPETSLAIQKMIFGQAAQASQDQSLFAYPFYSVLVFAPFAVIREFAMARAAWMTTLQITLVLIALISINLSRWRISKPALVVLVLFVLLWYHGFRPMIGGNASIVCTLFMLLSFLAIRSDHDVLAGIFLALASIKPQMVVLLVLFVLLWAASQKRWVLVLSLVASMVFLGVLGMFFIPDWIMQNLRQIMAYPSYTEPGTPGAIFTRALPGVGRQMGWVLTVFMGGVLVWEWRDALNKEFRWFLWAAYLTLVITNLIGVMTATENYIALFPALVLVLAVWSERWGVVGRGLTASSLVLLFFGLWWLFLATLDRAAPQPAQNPVMFFPLPIFLLIGLYWVRWWAIRPPRMILEDLAAQIN